MRSYPRINSSVTETEEQFDCFVERHLAGRASLYESDGASLPGDTVRVSATRKPFMDDVAVERHTVEFLSLDGDGHWHPVGSIDHSRLEIETMQGRYVQVESAFELAGPGIPDGSFSYDEVEPTVRAALDKLSAARLLPLRSLRPRRFARSVSEPCVA